MRGPLRMGGSLRAFGVPSTPICTPKKMRTRTWECVEIHIERNVGTTHRSKWNHTRSESGQNPAKIDSFQVRVPKRAPGVQISISEL